MHDYCPNIYILWFQGCGAIRGDILLFFFSFFFMFFFQNSRNVKESIITHFLLCTFVNVETHIACNYVPMSVVPYQFRFKSPSWMSVKCKHQLSKCFYLIFQLRPSKNFNSQIETCNRKTLRNSPSQFAPTILVYQVGLIFFQGLELLKKRSKIWVAKSRVQKNRVIVIQKE